MDKYKLFLDDIREPYCVFKLTVNPLFENNEDWVIVKDYDQFIDKIKKFFGSSSKVIFKKSHRWRYAYCKQSFQELSNKSFND